MGGGAESRFAWPSPRPRFLYSSSGLPPAPGTDGPAINAAITAIEPTSAPPAATRGACGDAAWNQVRRASSSFCASESR